MEREGRRDGPATKGFTHCGALGQSIKRMLLTNGTLLKMRAGETFSWNPAGGKGSPLSHHRALANAVLLPPPSRRLQGSCPMGELIRGDLSGTLDFYATARKTNLQQREALPVIGAPLQAAKLARMGA